MRGEMSAWNLEPGPSLSLLDFQEPPSGFGPFALRGTKASGFRGPRCRNEPVADGFTARTNCIVAYDTSYCQAKNVKRG